MCWTQPLRAQGDANLFYYISDGTNQLYSINRNTGVTTLIGSTGVGTIEALAYYPVPVDRTLFAADNGNFGTLNTSTGAFTLIAEIDGGGTASGSAGAQNLNDVDGLMLDARTLIMWAVERNDPGNDLLFQIDITTGQYVADAFGAGVDYLEITGDGIAVDVDDIGIDPLSGEIYGVANNAGSNDVLFKVNASTGVFELITSLSEDDIEGLAFSNDGRLYSSEGDSDNRLGLIDPITGNISNFQSFTGSDVEAIAALVGDASSISGTIFNDANANGVIDGGETGVAGVTVYLYVDKNSNGQVDLEDIRVQTTTSAVDGSYNFYFATVGTVLTTTEFTSYPAGFSLSTDNVEIASFTDEIVFGETDTGNDFGIATGIDCDGDGLSDIEEGFADTDGDGILDRCDLDSDNDGILDSVEGSNDFDGDGVADYLDLDSDDDGIPDAIEANQGTAPSEYVTSTARVTGTDSDGNGIVDSAETAIGSGVMVSANPDSDNDGLNDFLDLDADNDGILDILEAGGSSDVNGDGQVDGFTDTNGNGYDDALESSPLSVPNTDSAYETANSQDLRPNYIDQDSDADGIDDTREGYTTTGYRFPTIIDDLDQDGIIDFWDISSLQSPITPYDNDSDGIPDYIDINSDNDTESDFIEGNDANFDGIADTANTGIDANENGIDDAFDSNCVSGTSFAFGAGDHAEQNTSSGTVNLGSSDLEFLDDPIGAGDGNQSVGLYFPSISFDQGQSIGSAYVQFEVDETESGSVTITIEGHDTDNAQDFGDLTNVVGRTRTTASVTWSPPNWTTVGETGVDQRTVDLTDIIQEIVDRPGWVNGNALVLIFSGTNGAGRRTAENDPSLIIQTNNGTSTVCATNVSLPDEDGNGEYDFRETDQEDSDFDGIPDLSDIDDDNDGILDVDEGFIACTTVPEAPVNSVEATGGGNGVGGSNALINDGALTADEGLALNRAGEYIVIDLGPPDGLPSGTEIIFTLWDNNNDGKTLRFSQLSSSTFVSGGGDNGSTIDDTAISSGTSVTSFSYSLNAATRYLQIEMTSRSGGRIEVVEATVQEYLDCTGGSTDQDTDGDGIVDRLDLDSDNDGIPDIVEAGGVDTDNNGRVDNYAEGVFADGLASVFETGVAGESNQPLTDTDTDGVRDDLDLDSDNDGIQDIIEAGGVDSNGDGAADDNTDTNSNGWADTFDSANGGISLIDVDTDNDGLQNRIDIDSDGDGIVDLIESQATSGSPNVPLGLDDDDDGIDNAFDSGSGNNFTDPVDTDADTVPDYLDSNSDNDSFPDLLEAWDTDGDLTADTSPSGADTDGDGLDDAFDGINPPNATTNVYNNQDALDFPDITTSGGSDQDWREANAIDTDADGIPDATDIDDDNDGILDSDETSPGGSCPVLTVVSSSGVANPDNIIGLADGSIMEIDTNGEVIVVDFGQEYPAGTEYSITWQAIEGGTATMILSESVNPASSFVRNFSAPSVSQQSLETDLVTAAVAFRYLQITKESDPSITDFGVDAIVLTCNGDFDTDQDGILDRLDLDSDNDGIFDIIEAGGVDSDQDGRVDDDTDTNNNGWANTFDPANGGTVLVDPNSDGDALPNRRDIDSDADGIPDLIESQITSGSPIRPLGNDTDGDGIDDVFDVDNGGTVAIPTDTDTNSTPDYLDTDSDGDGLADVIEAWDNNGDFIGDTSPTGIDTDGDGLDDAFDNLSALFATLNVSNASTANSFPDVSTADQSTERDWRESNFSACEPGGVNTNLLLWLKANDGGMNWRDQSNNYVTVTSSGFVDMGSLINFNPTNSLSGSSYYSTNLDIDATNNPDLAVIAVYRPEANDAGAVWGEANSSFARYLFDGAGVNNESVSNGVGNETGITGLFANGEVTLSTVIFDEDQTNGSSVRVNGADILNFTSNHDAQASNSLQIGALGDNTQGFNGDIAEIIVYDQLLSSGTILNQIESYLAIKYGVTLTGATTGDYLASDGSTLFWDADEVSSFQNNVAGIARDDGSCLNQLQSKSINDDAIVTIGLDDNGDGLESSNLTNESSFNANLAALVWGHDGEPLYDNAVNIDYDPNQVNSRLNREWRVQRTGDDTDQVTVVFDVSNLLGPTGIGTNDEQQIVLLLDADGDFSIDASVVDQSFAINGDGEVVFVLPSFADGTYFTLASSEPGALPIVLLSFEAELYEQSVHLNWTTASETNNSFFRLERSRNGFDFEPIAYLDGAGTTNEINDYVFVDKTPMEGLNYYRLVDVATNGEENFSELKSVFFESNFDISLPYPNPVSRSGRLSIDLPVDLQVENLQLINIQGISVPFSYELSAKRIILVLAQVQKGVHFIRFQVGGKPYQFKVLILD
jgi:hypothetical protein